MWPGQQPPGGEQNPQDQNPYQQPGYQQPNPYQQPGYQQPGYPQPGQPQPGQPPQYQQPGAYQQPPTVPQQMPQYGMPGAPQPGGPGQDKKKTTIVAVVAATAVVVAAGVTGFLVLNDDEKKTVADPKPSVSASKPVESTAPPVDNPRGGTDAKPSIPGWKVVYNPKFGTQFDVPADWEVQGTGHITGFDDKKKNDGSAYIIMSAPADYKSKWCSEDTDKDGRMEDSGLATAGTRGAQGAKNTSENARNEAGAWVFAGFAQDEPENKLKQLIKISPATAYTTKSGLTGHVATATATGLTKKSKCETDGKSIAFSFKNSKGDFASFVLFANKGIKDELPDTMIQKILTTVRLAPVTKS
ncbi:hypothetical protein ACH44C_27690 [Streptomyces purpureus]|uniref:hypothetical protein n=1 Tax=Streptomyces purpureus TaxID=1951 RepID=UPI0037B41125